MTHEEYEAAARYWDEKDATGVKLDENRLRAMAEKYILANNTCALATGAGEYVRCTPVEYSWHDDCFWIFSEGGKKFVGLEKNPQVCLAIFDQYDGFGKLHGMQVTGTADLIEPFGEVYASHAAYKKIPLDALRRLPSPMHLIRIRPTRIDCLFSDIKELGCSPRQTLLLHENKGGASHTV